MQSSARDFAHDAVIHVYNAAGKIETHEHKGDFKDLLWLVQD
jgi:hypothetical protein